MIDNKLQISLQYLNPVLQELDKRGYPLAEIFKSAGLGFPAPLREMHEITLPPVEFTMLYRRSFALLEIERYRRPVEEDRIELMCCLAIACPDLASAIKQISTLSKTSHSKDIRNYLRAADNNAELVLEDPHGSKDQASLLVMIATMIFLHQIFSWAIGSRIVLRELRFRSPRPPEDIAMIDLLEAPVLYGQSQNVMIFDQEFLNWPVIRSYTDLQKVKDYLPFDIWYSGVVDMPLAGRIRNMFIAALHSKLEIPSISSLSQLCHMSEATLCRRLNSEGASYVTIKEKSQREFSEYMLRCTGEPISDIAQQAGFGEDRAFRRAFQRWTGVSPSSYRKLGLPESHEN